MPRKHRTLLVPKLLPVAVNRIPMHLQLRSPSRAWSTMTLLTMAALRTSSTSQVLRCRTRVAPTRTSPILQPGLSAKTVSTLGATFAWRPEGRLQRSNAPMGECNLAFRCVGSHFSLTHDFLRTHSSNVRSTQDQ